MIGTGSAAINLLNDVAVTLQGTSGGDDGVTSGRTLAGTAVTFLADRVGLRSNQNLADHGTAQHGASLMRGGKLDETLTIETKLEKKADAALLGLLTGLTGQVVQFTATATGCSMSGYMRVESVDPTYDAPSTLSITLRSYGSGLTIDNS